MRMGWYWLSPTTRYRSYDRYENYHITTNTSSVHQSTNTFIAAVQTMGTYWCAVRFLPPTALVLPGVQHQATFMYYSDIYSPVFALQTVASKTIVYS